MKIFFSAFLFLVVGNIYSPCLPEILSLKHSNLPGIPKALFFQSQTFFFVSWILTSSKLAENFKLISYKKC